MVPGLQNADFVRLGVIHRNTYLEAPNALDATLQLRARPGVYVAGQLTGVEGYVESAAMGIYECGDGHLRRDVCGPAGARARACAPRPALRLWLALDASAG